jgi:hypothetical protein
MPDDEGENNMSTRLNNRIRETEDEIAKAMQRRDDLLDKLVPSKTGRVD